MRPGIYKAAAVYVSLSVFCIFDLEQSPGMYSAPERTCSLSANRFFVLEIRCGFN